MITRDMMLGLRKVRRIRLKSNPEGVEVGYSGLTSQIASVHQFCGMDQVMPDGPKVRYPVRAMLGISKEDRMDIHEKVMIHIKKAFK